MEKRFQDQLFHGRNFLEFKTKYIQKSSCGEKNGNVLQKPELFVLYMQSIITNLIIDYLFSSKLKW